MGKQSLHWVLLSIIWSFSCSNDKPLLPYAKAEPPKPVVIVEKEPEPVIIQNINDVIFLPKDSVNLAKFAKLTPSVFEIRSAQNIPVKTDKGIVINLDYDKILTLDGKEVYYPYTLSLYELKNIKDLILHDKSNVHITALLNHHTSVYLDVRKKNQRLIPKFGQVEISIPTDNQSLKTNLFYEIPTQVVPEPTWVKDESPRSIFFENKNYYRIFPYKFGWIGTNIIADKSIDPTRVNLISAYPELSKIKKYIILPKLKSIMRVEEGISYELPLGVDAELFAIAISNKKEYYVYQEKFQIKKNLSLKIDLKPIKNAELLKLIENF